MGALGVDETLAELLACICEKFEDEGAPFCKCSSTIGVPVVAQCCECSDGVTGELWGSLGRIYRRGTNGPGYPQTGTMKPCQQSEWVAEYNLTLARCFPTLDNLGQLPSSEDQAAAALALHADVSTLERAIRCCALPEAAYAAQIQVINDPSGGCSYLTAIVQVPVSLSRSDNPRGDEPVPPPEDGV